MLRQILRYALTLMGLQAVLGGIAFLLADYRWAAIPVALLFLALVGWAGTSFAADLRRGLVASTAAALTVGLLWQLPGLQGTVRFGTDLIGWTTYDGITDLQDFLMETWHTVLLPLVGSVPAGQVLHYYARYYILLVASSPLLILVFGSAAAICAVRRARRAATQVSETSGRAATASLNR